MINASSEKDQVTILELTDQELEGIRGGCHHESHDDEDSGSRFGFNDRRFSFKDSRDSEERFSFRESFRSSRRDSDW
jgi:hypothetical protein